MRGGCVALNLGGCTESLDLVPGGEDSPAPGPGRIPNHVD